MFKLILIIIIIKTILPEMSENDLIEISSITNEPIDFLSSTNSLMGFSTYESSQFLVDKIKFQKENNHLSNLNDFINDFLSSKINAFQMPIENSLEFLEKN
jgi:hypothetical protein